MNFRTAGLDIGAARSWTDLKAEVDRQRGKAEVAAPGLAQEIASRFRLGDVTGAMRSLSRPDEIGRLWVVQTADGDWAPRTVDDVFPVTDGEENARFQEAAARAGVTLPAPLRSRTGAVVELTEGHQGRVYEWLHSAPPLAAPVSARLRASSRTWPPPLGPAGRRYLRQLFRR